MKRTAMKNTLFIISVTALSLLLACCVLGILLLPIKIVYAESTQEVVYAPVSDLENNEYAGASSIKIKASSGATFYIPESYYLSDITLLAPIDDTNESMYSVSYCGTTFFVQFEGTPQTSSVTFADGVFTSPNVLLVPKEGAAIIYNEEAKALTTEHTIRFLGYHTEDSTKIFIVATKDGTSLFGFANRDDFENFVVPYHPIAQAERDELLASKHTPDPDNGDIIPNTSLTLRIILIIGICVPAVIIAFLLFKPSKAERTQGKNTLHKNRTRDDFDYDSPRTYSSDRPSGYDDGYDRGYSRGYNDARNNNPDNRYDN